MERPPYEIALMHDHILRLEEAINQLKAELEAERNWHKTADEISKANSEYTAKLKQTLAEIEKLAIQGNVYCVDYNVNDCEKCIKQSDCKTTLFKQILQKISEVIDD